MARKSLSNRKTSIDVALEVISGKWKLSICHLLLGGAMRTGQLRRSLVGITERMLIRQLRELESDGIIEREIYLEIPPRVEYRLSKHGRTLRPIIRTLSKWGYQHAIVVYGKKGVQFEVEKTKGCE